MRKMHVYLRAEELEALRVVAERSGRSIADLVREAIQQIWLRPDTNGPVALWNDPSLRTSVEHDQGYDAP